MIIFRYSSKIAIQTEMNSRFEARGVEPAVSLPSLLPMHHSIGFQRNRRTARRPGGSTPSFSLSTILTAAASSILLFAAGANGAITSRDHVWDITFPVEKGAVTYERMWHNCRDSGCTRAHRAVDLHGTPGTPVYAVADGTIKWQMTSASSGWAMYSGAGYTMYMDTPDGAFRHSYGHFGPKERDREHEAFAVNPATGQLWKVGDFVRRGQVIGYLGSSGATASGPHLHFEIRSIKRSLPHDDPGPDAIEGRSYGDPNATLGSFSYLRYDPFPSLQAAESRGDYPGGPLQVGDFVMVYGVAGSLNVRGPDACGSPISGAAKPKGSIGRIIGGPASCPQITQHNLWQILWEDCTVGWSSERYLIHSRIPDTFCEAYEVSVTVQGAGNITRSPDQAIYFHGQTIELHAQAEPEFAFAGWLGSTISMDNPLNLTVGSNQFLLARFVRSYDAWTESRFSPAEQTIPGFTDPDGDPYHHGIANLAVFAFGLDARHPERDSLPRVEQAADRLLFVFHQLKDDSDVRYIVEQSADLQNWTRINRGASWETVDLPGEIVKEIRVPLESDPSGATRFVRLRLER